MLADEQIVDAVYEALSKRVFRHDGHDYGIVGCAVGAAFAVLIALPNGGTVPLGEVAAVTLGRGPTTIRTENGQLVAYVYVDIRNRDLGGYVTEAKNAVAASVTFPPGYYVTWSGQYEYLERAAARLKLVVPVTLLIIFLLLYLNFRNFDGHVHRAAVAAVLTGGRPVGASF